jgi:hypothetical protein
MSQDAKRVAALIDSIANKRHPGLRHPVMSGTVVAGSVDTEEGTCKVVLSVDDEQNPTEGILINAVTLNNNGLILYPADDSNVWVAEIDGPGKWGIVKCSDLVKVSAVIGGAALVMTADGFSIKAGGKDLKTVMGNILTHITLLTVPTPSGTNSVPVNVADFNTDLSDLNSILI